MIGRRLRHLAYVTLIATSAIHHYRRWQAGAYTDGGWSSIVEIYQQTIPPEWWLAVPMVLSAVYIVVVLVLYDPVGGFGAPQGGNGT